MIKSWSPIGPYEIGNKSRQIWLQPMCTTDFVTYQYSMPRPLAENNNMVLQVMKSRKQIVKKPGILGHARPFCVQAWLPVIYQNILQSAIIKSSSEPKFT